MNDDATPDRPVLVYDGDCGFCTYWARRWREKVQGRIEIVALQDESRRPPGLVTAELEESVHLVEPDHTVRRGADAVIAVLAMLRRYRPLRWAYRWIPPVRWGFDLVYWLVANNRMTVSRWTRWMRRNEVD